MTRSWFWAGAVAVALLLLAGVDAQAASLKETNLVDLLRDAESIVVGQVQSVGDGIDEHGVPYTEIQLDVSETIRGGISGTYTFRQFGLRAPRLTADGTKKMMPAPEIFPRYAEGESVVLFLYRTASWTGLQTTVGLGQGKFVLGPGRVENDLANQGLFANVSLAKGLATPGDDRMLATGIGAVNPDSFLSLVRRAVTNRWVENAQIWRTDEGRATTNRNPDRKLASVATRTGASSAGTSRLDRN